MRFPPLRKPGARRPRGVALIIVLAFVVLLTGLVVAFFSRSLSERQISNSSASQVKIDLFAQGAIATITDDLKQEIAAGSNATFYNYTDPTTQITTTRSVYLPTNPATAAPALALKGGSWQSAVTAFPANLVKRSAYGQNFFPTSVTGDTGGGNYNTSNTTATVTEPTTPGATPAPAAAPDREPSNRAAGLNNRGFSTTIASANGRAISAARWNKSLLLPKAHPASATDLTPYFADPGNPNPSNAPVSAASGGSFVPPDWILVARDGTNPGSLKTGITFGATQNPSVNNPAAVNPGYVTGRFAYAIYDEGGLLDANAAGYPTTPAGYPSNGTGSLPQTPTAKTSLAYADLTVPVTLPDGTVLNNLLTPAQVNALVGWRNYASSQPPGGTFPNYLPAPTASPASSPIFSPFDISLLTNPNGFMQANNTPLYKNQSDRMFGSRQELINFFTQVMPASLTDTNAISSLQNALQYFGTFSRSLNQPSYTPVSRVGSATNPNPRPLIQPSTAVGTQPGGGNNVGDAYNTPLLQDIFSPNLLSVRAEATFTRNDGTTTAVVGEPLVKSRFALQRLAWLTYQGPSAEHTTDPNVQKLITNYGLSPTYPQKGTAANIQKYFGLTWDTTNHYWKYNVHNGNGAGSGPIMKLQEIADQQKREPDFFELLKASVDPGALGKSSMNGTNAAAGDVGSAPLNFNYKRDVSLDAAIFQLGANIIDQYDLDGYPTRIYFVDNNGIGREIRGVENLPYIYRLRTGTLKVRESNPISERPPTGAGSDLVPYLHSGTQAGYKANPLIDTGVGIIMTVPDIWNPHDQNSSLGNPYPGQTSAIRLVANSGTPDAIYMNAGSTLYNGYSKFLTGGYGETDAAHGRTKIVSYNDAILPDATTTPPTPYFTRGLNVDGRLNPTNNPTLIMTGTNGGFNNPHFISPTTTDYLTFKVPSNNTLYHEPTMLGQADPIGGSALTMVVDPSFQDIIRLQGTGGVSAYVGTAPTYGIKTISGYNPLGVPGVSASASQGFIGMILGTYPLRWVGPHWGGSNVTTTWNYSDESLADTGQPIYAVTYSLQYLDPVGGGSNYVTYDEKYVDSDLTFVHSFEGQINQPGGGNYTFIDPRTPRFGSPTETNISGGVFLRAPLIASPPANWASTWLDYSGKLLSVVTERPDISSGFGSNFRGTISGDWGGYAVPGLHVQAIDTAGGTNFIFFQTGLLAQNDPTFSSDGLRFINDVAGGAGQRDANFWSDPDGVVRRAMGAYVTTGSTTAQPLATATSFSAGVGKPNLNGQSQSRPIVLNRPFRSVAELGYVFSGNPWKNVDFSTPESAYSELLDVFCINDTSSPDGLVAGTVDLNTRQPAVLKSVLTGAYTDEENTMTPAVTSPTPLKPLTAADAEAIAKLLVTRTSVAPTSNTNHTKPPTGPQPLQNVGDLVGRWNSRQTINGNFNPGLGGVHNIDGSNSYDGFSADLTSLSNLASLPTDTIKIPRLRESAVRALSNVGNTRVWNLMIDVIAQSGRFPPAATAANNFVVEGEQRYWVHLAIDRYTGAVLEAKPELVKE